MDLIVFRQGHYPKFTHRIPTGFSVSRWTFTSPGVLLSDAPAFPRDRRGFFGQPALHAVKKVMQITFSGSWDWGGCLPHITWPARNAREYEHYFPRATGKIIAGRSRPPHYGFIENARANRVFNKILKLNKCCFFGLDAADHRGGEARHFTSTIGSTSSTIWWRGFPTGRKSVHLSPVSNKLVIPKAADLLIGVEKLVIAWIDCKASPDQPMRVLHNPFRSVPGDGTQGDGEAAFSELRECDRKATWNLFRAVVMLQAEGFDFEVKAVGHVFPDLKTPRGVTVAKWIPQSEFLEIAAQASAYICATYATPFSVAVLEAMARKTPVICPWDIGALDLLPPDCVISYESHSAVAMADAMRTFSQDAGSGAKRAGGSCAGSGIQCLRRGAADAAARRATT